MLKIDDIDFSKCLIDPTRTTVLNDIKATPEFCVELGYRMSKKGIMTYIVLMYDYQCSLWREVRNFAIRKGVAMQLAGFKQDKEGHFERHIERIIEGKNQDVNSMIVRYISLLNNPKWAQLCSYENLYYYEMARVQNGAFGKTKEVVDNLEKLSNAISKLTDEILGGSGEAEPILAAIYKEATKDLNLSPEKISDYIMSFDADVPKEWNPYIEWKKEDIYVVDKPKFIGDK